MGRHNAGRQRGLSQQATWCALLGHLRQLSACPVPFTLFRQYLYPFNIKMWTLNACSPLAPATHCFCLANAFLGKLSQASQSSACTLISWSTDDWLWEMLQRHGQNELKSITRSCKLPCVGSQPVWFWPMTGHPATAKGQIKINKPEVFSRDVIWRDLQNRI